MTAYDAIVIGTGQAGPYVTSRLAGAGMKVAVIERNAFGGTCVNTGCIPTKTMVASAYAARMAARAAEYGVDVGPVRVDMKRVKARKDAVSKAVAHRSRRLAAEHGELHRLPGPRPLRIRARGERRRRAPPRGQDLHQRRRPGARSRHAGASRDRLSHQQLDDVGGLSAEAPDRRRRQLHRSRIRSDVSALRRRGHGHRDGAAARRPRGRRRVDRDPGDRRARGRRGAREREVHQLRQARRRDRRQRRLHRRCAASARHARAARRRPPSQYRRSGPREGGGRGRRAGLRRGRRPAPHERPGNLGARRLQRQGRVHAHVVQRRRDRDREPARERSAPGERSDHRLRAVRRSAARSGRDDGGERFARAGARRSSPSGR